VAYAQQGVKGLLVDCDLRKARLHRMFGFPGEPGLTDLVLEQAGLDEVVHDFPVEGLDVITSGAQPPNPSELVGGARMRSTLEGLCRDYELVILDTPPLIAGPDAAILGSFCDGVLLVIRAGRTEREAGQQAVRQLHTVGARILGSVLNDPDGELPRYSSYYAYQYEYYSSEG
jgi:capsular exopolysaccharide synthesis family protein